jgi:(2Fe-2S) ferredoxin
MSADKRSKKAKKAQKRIGPKLTPGEAALVVCVDDKCAPREVSRAMVDHTRAYVSEQTAAGRTLPVRVEVFGCLGVCKKGPIAALIRPAAAGKGVKVKKKVDDAKARKLVERLVAKLAAEQAGSPA